MSGVLQVPDSVPGECDQSATAAQVRRLQRALRAAEADLAKERDLRLYREATIKYLLESNRRLPALSLTYQQGKDLFDAQVHRHPNGHPPDWHKQPRDIQDLWVRKALGRGNG